MSRPIRIRARSPAASTRGRSRRRGHSDSSFDPESAPSPEPLAPHHQALVDLQQTAGNRAVAAIIRRNADHNSVRSGEDVTAIAPDDSRLGKALSGEATSLHQIAQQFGDWETAERHLRLGSGAAHDLAPKVRTELWNALVKHRTLIASMLGLQNATPLPSASTTPTSDFDLNVGGTAPGAGLVKSREQMDTLFPGWEKVYKMGLVVSVARLTSLADELDKAKLPGVDTDRLLTENAALAEQLLLERRLRSMTEEQRQAALGALPEHDRVRLRKRSTMTSDQMRAEQNEMLRISDTLTAQLLHETDPRKKVELAAMVSSAQMQANSLSDDMYVTMQAGRDLTGKTPIASSRHAYLSTIDQIDMLQHLVVIHGGIGPAAQRYEIAKYASRILHNMKRAGITDPRVESLAAKANHVYKLDRNANMAGPGVFGVNEFETLRSLVGTYLPAMREAAHKGSEHGPSVITETVGHLPQSTALDSVWLPTVSSKSKTKGVLEPGKAGIAHETNSVDPSGSKTAKTLTGAWVTGGGEISSSTEVEQPDGKKAKSDTSLTVTTSGIAVKRNGKSFTIASNELGGGVEKGFLGDKLKVGMSFSIKAGVSTEQLDARYADGAAGTLASLLPIVDKADDPTNIRSIADTTGYKVGASVGYDKGPFGASVEGSVEDYDTTRFVTTEKAAGGYEENAMVRDARERAALGGRISGVSGISDVNVDSLKTGEGYSFEHKGAKSVAGSVTVYGVNAGLGYADAGFEQTALAKTGDSSFRVTMTATQDEDVTGHIGIKGLSLAAGAGKGTDAAVSFSASGPQGVAALKGFQATGLLPGAEGVVSKTDPAAWGDFVSARGTLAVAMQGDNALDIDFAKRAVFAKSKDLNRVFMDSNGWSLPEATVPGVTYDEHATGRSSSESIGLKLGPLDLMHSVTERMWERDYRSGADTKTELGASESEHNIIAPDETESSITAPKSNEGAAWILAEEGTLGEESRQRIGRTGTQFMAGPKEVQQSWLSGDYHDAEKNTLAIAFTEDQLAAMRDRVAVLKPSDGDAFVADLALVREQAETMRRSSGLGMSIPLPKWVDQLDELEAAARAARARQQAGGDPSGLARGGMFANTVLSPQDVTEHFDALTKEERRLIVVSGAMAGANNGYGKGWNPLKLVLRVKDLGERNELLREVFAVVARRDDDANAPMELLAFLEQSADSEGIKRDELNTIVSNTQVATMDTGPLDNAKKWREELRLKGVEAANKWGGERLCEVLELPDDGNMVSAQFEWQKALGENEANVVQYRADRVTDLLEGLATTAGPAGLDKAIDEALARDPLLLFRMKQILQDDPARLALAQDYLKSGRHHLP